MGILAGKNILVTGVGARNSIGYAVAEIAQAEGANVVVSNVDRALSLTMRSVKKLNPPPPVVELDVTDETSLVALPDNLANYFDQLDGVVHSIAFAKPRTALGGNFLTTSWEDVATSLHTSAYSLKSLTMALKPIFADKGSVVGLTFGGGLSWPNYDWMGVAKAALESTSQYLARYLGSDQIRVNLVSAGPLDTIAKKAIPGAEQLNQIWDQRAPLGWDSNNTAVVGKAVVALLSDWFIATTGEVIHVDGGLHSTGG